MTLKKHEIIYYYVKIHNEIKRKSKKSGEKCTKEKEEFLRKTEEYCMFIQSSCWYNALVTNKELQIH